MVDGVEELGQEGTVGRILVLEESLGRGNILLI